MADRLLDARLSPQSTLQERHRFHDRHRQWFLVAAVPVALVLAMLVVRMPHSLLLSYCVLGMLSLGYLGLVHLPFRAHDGSVPAFPKEFVVALLFAAASALPASVVTASALASQPLPHLYQPYHRLPLRTPGVALHRKQGLCNWRANSQR